ncbi:hypothetical protein MASR1M65_09830 [Saprospiraceae bacterium]
MASDLGIALYKQSGGTIVDDFDNDGNLDIVVTGWSLKANTPIITTTATGHFLIFPNVRALIKYEVGST